MEIINDSSNVLAAFAIQLGTKNGVMVVMVVVLVEPTNCTCCSVLVDAELIVLIMTFSRISKDNGRRAEKDNGDGEKP
jgi:hypothetical protein